MRVLLCAVLVLSTGLPAFAQSPVRLDAATTIGTIAANGQAVTFSGTDIGGIGSAKVQTLDSYNGTWEVQCSLDGTTFDASAELTLVKLDDTTQVTSVTDEVGIWSITNADACSAIKVIATGGFAATNTTIVISAIQPGGGGGSGGAGAATGNVNVEEIAGVAAPLITDALADNHANTQDALAVLSFPTIFDGATWDRDTGARSISNFSTDGVAFDDGTTQGLAIFCRRDDSSLSPGGQAIDGDLGPVACGAYMQPWVSLLNPADGTAYSFAVDATLGTTTFTEATTTAPIAGVVRNDTADSLVNTTNEISALGVDANGLLWTRFLDPCSGLAKTYYVVDIASSGTVEIANAVASQFFYICSIDLHTNAANNVVIAEDDTDSCSSISAGVTGGTTAAEGWNFGANGGRTLGNGLGTVAKTTTTQRYLCILTSANTQLSGVISYVSAP